MPVIKLPSGDHFTLNSNVTVVRMKGIDLQSKKVSVTRALTDVSLFSGREILVNWPTLPKTPMGPSEEYEYLKEAASAIATAQMTENPLIVLVEEGTELSWLNQIGVMTFDFNDQELAVVPNEAELDANLLYTSKYRHIMLIIDTSKWTAPLGDTLGANDRYVHDAWDAFRATLKDPEQLFNLFYWDHSITDRTALRTALLEVFNDDHMNIVIGFDKHLPEKWKTYADDVFIWDGAKLTTDSDFMMATPPDGVDEISYALGLVVEECSEISYTCMKALRFGLHGRQPGDTSTNLEKIVKEVHDLHACLMVLEEQLKVTGIDVHFTGSVDLIKRKLDRLQFFQQRSIDNGRLSRSLIIPEVNVGEPKSAD